MKQLLIACFRVNVCVKNYQNWFRRVRVIASQMELFGSQCKTVKIQFVAENTSEWQKTSNTKYWGQLDLNFNCLLCLFPFHSANIRQVGWHYLIFLDYILLLLRLLLWCFDGNSLNLFSHLQHSAYWCHETVKSCLSLHTTSIIWRHITSSLGNFWGRIVICSWIWPCNTIPTYGVLSCRMQNNYQLFVMARNAIQYSNWVQFN